MSSGSLSKHETGGSIRRLLPGLLEASRDPQPSRTREGEPPRRQEKRGFGEEKSRPVAFSPKNPSSGVLASWRLSSLSRASGPRGAPGESPARLGRKVPGRSRDRQPISIP